MAPALWFLPFAAPICIYVAWHDMAFMRIPNRAVIALAAVFAVVGAVLLPWPEYGLRWLHLAGVLLLGFVANALGLLGAGDAKFAAAMAPFVARDDAAGFAAVFAATLLAAFAAHRGARRIGAVRTRTPDWQSWGRGDFPMGLALGPALIVYLALAAL